VCSRRRTFPSPGCISSWFEDLQIKSDGSQTVISGLVADQPALHGLLVKVRDLGLCLISVHRLDPDEPQRKHTSEPQPKPRQSHWFSG
jgi:hypothetical protein